MTTSNTNIVIYDHAYTLQSACEDHPLGCEDHPLICDDHYVSLTI